jgi:hypothetical protein
MNGGQPKRTELLKIELSERDFRCGSLAPFAISKKTVASPQQPDVSETDDLVRLGPNSRHRSSSLHDA